MQILQRLFKNANETTPCISNKHTVNDQKAKSSKEIVLFGICRGDKSRSRNSELFNSIFCRKDIGKEYFYNTIKLRRLGRQYCMKMKKEKADSSSNHVGNITQILPITHDSTNDGGEKKEKCKADSKAKMSISKMKELIRWAAAAKSDKGTKYITRKVFNFRNRATLKAIADDDELSNESPKISFRWEVESCSTTYSAPTTTNHEHSIQINFPSLNSTPTHTHHCPKLNWITTDSECNIP